MNESDLETGFPTPPEGMWWRVGMVTNSYYPSGREVVGVSLMHKVKVRDCVKRGSIFSRPVYEDIDRDAIFLSRFVTIGTSEFNYHDFTDITPKHLIDTAEKVMKDHRNTERAAANRERFTGDYPPKTLI